MPSPFSYRRARVYWSPMSPPLAACTSSSRVSSRGIIHTRERFSTIVQQVKTGSRIRTWPTPQDYNEAVQNLHINVQDADLKVAEVETSPLGLPRPITGSFASVYKVMAGQRQWALRCFLRDIPDTQWRYGRIADYLKQHRLPYTVQFEFQFQGIQIAGRWYPILKMDWVEG